LAEGHRIPAISIRQPWAELILRGTKTMEVRKWHDAYRGPLWVHTGLRPDGHACVEYALRDPSMSELFTGGFVGLVELTAIISFDARCWEDLRPEHLDTGSFRPRLFGFFLKHARRLRRPVEAKGDLGLFYPDTELQTTLAGML